MGDDSLSEGPLPIIWIIGKYEGKRILYKVIRVLSFILQLLFSLYVLRRSRIRKKYTMQTAGDIHRVLSY